MACEKIGGVCVCGRACGDALVAANANFSPDPGRPEKVKRASFRQAALDAAVRYKRSMQILA